MTDWAAGIHNTHLTGAASSRTGIAAASAVTAVVILSRAALLLAPLLLAGCFVPAPKHTRTWHPTRYPSVGQTPGDGTNLRLISYNVWGLPAWLNRTSPTRYARMADALEQQNQHIVLLQEVWSRRAREAIPAGSDWAVVSGPNTGCFFQRHGLVSLSRFKVLAAEFMPFRRASWPDSMVKKGALKITVDIGDSRILNVWNVHLQAGPAPRTRSAQIAQLIDWVERSDDDQVADVIAGDFNCTPGSAEYDQLRRRFGSDIQRQHPPFHFATYNGRSSKPGQARTLDFVFVRPRRADLTCAGHTRPLFDAVRPEERLSDHLGLGADMSLSIPSGSRDATSAALASVSSPVPAAQAWHRNRQVER